MKNINALNSIKFFIQKNQLNERDSKYDHRNKRLPIALAHIKAGITLKNLLNNLFLVPRKNNLKISII